MLTIPTIEWVAKIGANRSKLAGFSVATYGSQKVTACSATMLAAAHSSANALTWSLRDVAPAIIPPRKRSPPALARRSDARILLVGGRGVVIGSPDSRHGLKGSVARGNSG